MRTEGKYLNDQDLDQLFRDAHAAESIETFYNPEYWSEMESLLPKEEKRVFPYWTLLTATLVFAVTLALYPTQNESFSSLREKTLPAQHASKQVTSNSKQHPSEAKLLSNTIQPNADQSTVLKEQKAYKHDKLHFANKVNEVESESLVKNEETHESTTDHVQADFIDVTLPPRSELLAKQSIHSLPIEPTSHEKRGQWYVELGPTIGQSPYLSSTAKRNVVGGAVLGGGYTWKLNTTVIGLGLQFRMEGFGGLQYRETNFASNMQRTVSVKQLFSLDLPIKFGFVVHKSEFSLAFVPGVQLFSHGKEEVMENQQLTREASYTGKVEHSNSLTMELGLNYYYHFTNKWSIGAKLQTDVLRPLHTDYYLGKSTTLPLNGQLVLRRSF